MHFPTDYNYLFFTYRLIRRACADFTRLAVYTIVNLSVRCVIHFLARFTSVINDTIRRASFYCSNKLDKNVLFTRGNYLFLWLTDTAFKHFHTTKPTTVSSAVTYISPLTLIFRMINKKMLGI